ncbi:three-helix bundle dimerization domain-containing protein [Microbacterium sp.]|uniref:three-helix bundle dimerization domain-containing protein n=1 Tax=Microbacterium sp. TaxID=51671 RepID=UPI0039198B61
MDENAVEVGAPSRPADAVHVIDGVRVTSFSGVVERLLADYPDEDPVHVEAVVLREWEAFSAGRPLVLPTAVEEGAREILDQPLV